MAEWAGIVSVIAVIISLFCVGYSVQQNTDAVRASVFNEARLTRSRSAIEPTLLFSIPSNIERMLNITIHFYGTRFTLCSREPRTDA